MTASWLLSSLPTESELRMNSKLWPNVLLLAAQSCPAFANRARWWNRHGLRRQILEVCPGSRQATTQGVAGRDPKAVKSGGNRDGGLLLQSSLPVDDACGVNLQRRPHCLTSGCLPLCADSKQLYRKPSQCNRGAFCAKPRTHGCSAVGESRRIVHRVFPRRIRMLKCFYRVSPRLVSPV